MPVRPVRLHCRKTEVTMPSFVARKIVVAAGNYLVWCCTGVAGGIEIAECAAVYERDLDGLPIMGRQLAISKVREDTGSLVITIPKEVQAVLGDVTGKYIEYGTTKHPYIVTIKTVEQKEISIENDQNRVNSLMHWPVLIEDCTQAWLEGFEPFAQAMAETVLPPRFARRNPINMWRVFVENKIMISTANSQAVKRRSDQWSSRS